jgi:hypothetical protein
MYMMLACLALEHNRCVQAQHKACLHNAAALAATPLGPLQLLAPQPTLLIGWYSTWPAAAASVGTTAAAPAAFVAAATAPGACATPR